MATKPPKLPDTRPLKGGGSRDVSLPTYRPGHVLKQPPLMVHHMMGFRAVITVRRPLRAGV